jgi:hypothetical protein
MKRSWIVGTLVSLFLIQGTVKVVLADSVAYPFEAIRIVEAQRFQITVPETIVDTSLFFSDVTVGETLNVYIGSLTLVQGEDSVATSMIVVSTEEGNDLAQYIINSRSLNEEFETFSFAWHILIDPTIGVYKDLDKVLNMKELYLKQTLGTDSWEFRDDQQTLYPMVENSFAFETNLDILIAAYVESTEENTDNDSATMYHFLKAFSEIGLTGCATNSNASSNNSSSINAQEEALGHTALIDQISTSLKAVFE